MAGAGIGTIFLDSTDGGYNAIADGIDVSTLGTYPSRVATKNESPRERSKTD